MDYDLAGVHFKRWFGSLSLHTARKAGPKPPIECRSWSRQLRYRIHGLQRSHQSMRLLSSVSIMPDPAPARASRTITIAANRPTGASSDLYLQGE
jgi:hypothetical protein